MNRTEPSIRWAWLGIALAALWLFSRVLGSDELDAHAKVEPRNPLLEVNLNSLSDGQRLELDVIGLWELRSGNGDLLAKGDGMRGWLSFQDGRFTVGGWISTSNHAVLHSFGDAAIVLDTWRYRGSLHLRKKPKRRGKPAQLEVALELPQEDYVLGVVTGEMSTSKNGIEEALKAQAIAARTYAVYQLRRGRSQLSSTASDQRFLPVDMETDAARKAVSETKGMILRHKEEYVPAFFHADCGGSTSNGIDSGFGNSIVLQGVAEPADASHKRVPHTWSERVDAAELDRMAVDLKIGSYVDGLQILRRDPGGRVLEAKFTGSDGSHIMPGEELRRRFSLPSAMIDLIGVLRDGSVMVEGRGRGHGIGLCQLGAQDLARGGRSCEQILQHYYPGASIEALTEPIETP